MKRVLLIGAVIIAFYIALVTHLNLLIEQHAYAAACTVFRPGFVKRDVCVHRLGIPIMPR
jgi:hypothetical protein